MFQKDSIINISTALVNFRFLKIPIVFPAQLVIPILSTKTSTYLWNAFAIVTFKFVTLWTFSLDAPNFVIVVRTIVGAITSLRIINTKCCFVCRSTALELLIEADEFITIHFIGIIIIATLIFAITDLYRFDAIRIGTLILARFTFKLSARSWLITHIATIILSITAPIKRNTFFCCSALKFRRCTIGYARPIISR